MARGQDSSDSDEGKILSPDELDISDDEHVVEIDEGRYVVSPNGPIDGAITPTVDADTDSDPVPDTRPDSGTREFDADSVHDWLSAELDSTKTRYGFDVTAKFDGSVEQRQMMSNDVVTIFESLMLWYVQQVDSTTPVEEILGILLTESNVPIRYPPASLRSVLETTDLSPDDTIADLIAAVESDEGLQI